MPTASAISLIYTPRDEKCVLYPFFCALLPGEARPNQQGRRAALRGILAND